MLWIGLCWALAAAPIDWDAAAATYDVTLRAELQQLQPAALPAWDEAGAARRANDAAGADRHYGRVLELAPQFHHAMRRRCSAKLELDQLAAARELCTAALAAADIPENQLALAHVLVAAARGQQAPPADVERARRLVAQALAAAPADATMAATACQIAARAADAGMLGDASARLAKLDPDGFAGHYFGAVAAAMDGRTDTARSRLERAHARGLPDDEYERMAQALDGSRPWLSRHLTELLAGLGAWLGLLVVLVLAGMALSAATLRSAQKVPSDPSGRAGGADLWLRRIYRGVLWACCAYYYLSVPLVGALVLVAGGGVLYGLLALGRIPIKLLFIVGAVVLATLWSVLRAFFVRGQLDADPGVRLAPGAHPRLEAVLREVASRVGTRPVDVVFLTPGTEVAVWERGGVFGQLAGRTQRCLVLGAGILDGLQERPFKAVLAHEYGHFVNADTAGGGFALAVRRSLGVFAGSLAQSGAATWYNPAWWFVLGFVRVFDRISQGASRLQEILADRWAAFAYGADAFATGLRHVLVRSVEFHAVLDKTLDEVLAQKRGLANLYRYQPKVPPDPAELLRAAEQVIDALPSPYDSHPRPADRIAWVRALGATGTAGGGDDERAAWELFSDRQAVELEMTREVRINLASNYGVEIAADETPAPVEEPVA